MSNFDKGEDEAVALVTGAAGGIARALLGGGAKVALTDIDTLTANGNL